MDEILTAIIIGQYSDWFFDVFMTNSVKAILNNFALLWIIAKLFQKGSKLTKNKYDDWVAGKMISFLSRFRKTKKEK